MSMNSIVATVHSKNKRNEENLSKMHSGQELSQCMINQSRTLNYKCTVKKKRNPNKSTSFCYSDLIATD